MFTVSVNLSLGQKDGFRVPLLIFKVFDELRQSVGRMGWQLRRAVHLKLLLEIWPVLLTCWYYVGKSWGERYFDMNYFCQLALLDICVSWPWSHQTWGVKWSWLLNVQGSSCWVSLALHFLFFSFGSERFCVLKIIEV